MADVYASIPAVLGPEDVSNAAADRWGELRQVDVVQGMRQRIYQLDAVSFPRPLAAGHMRMAEAGDLPIVIPWLEGFLDATGLTRNAPVDDLAERLTAGGFLALWVDGDVVSMAGLSASA